MMGPGLWVSGIGLGVFEEHALHRSVMMMMMMMVVVVMMMMMMIRMIMMLTRGQRLRFRG